MKFGVKITSTVEEAKWFDKENGKTLWQDDIAKERSNSRVAFDPLDEGEPPPPGYKPIGCHLIFEVKPDLCWKARYVAEGYRSKPPTAMSYASVVGRGSVRIGFLLATLNNLDVLAGDIQNAFLNAPCAEKVYFIGGPEWGALTGRVIVIVRALYGHKSAGASWRHHFADFLRSPEMNFFEPKADENVWMKAATFPDGRKYYTYIFFMLMMY